MQQSKNSSSVALHTAAVPVGKCSDSALGAKAELVSGLPVLVVRTTELELTQQVESSSGVALRYSSSACRSW